VTCPARTPEAVIGATFFMPSLRRMRLSHEAPLVAQY
jgi:hypothetical protein